MSDPVWKLEKVDDKDPVWHRGIDREKSFIRFVGVDEETARQNACAFYTRKGYGWLGKRYLDPALVRVTKDSSSHNPLD